ncbi:MAG: DUF2793 domain-containing protein [Paracoccaceae bacterium]
MSNSPRLGLPLLQAAQAQKHVTVNEALVLLDGVGQMSLISATVSVPPGLASDGDCYGIPAGSVNEWAANIGDVAIYSNGGWVFVTPMRGWGAWVQDVGEAAMFDGTLWRAGVHAMSANGAATVHQVLEIDHTLAAGATDAVVAAIPAFSIVIGVTGRITTAVTGTLATWRLGVAGSDNRYGSGLGVSLGAWVRGISSSPLTYYADTDLLLTAEGGDFAAGDIRLAVHLMRLEIPSV